jgi:hypothetical protein
MLGFCRCGIELTKRQIPKPLAAHYQVAVYAIAEQAVDIILGELGE